MRHRSRTSLLLTTALLLAAAGCSTKSSDSGTGGAATAGAVKTGPGISGNTVTLGVITDLTGPFASLGTDVTNAQVLYWEQQNKAGGVCGKYQVKLDVKDTSYNVQQGVQLYSAAKGEVLALQQLLGSPLNTALEQSLTADKIVNIPTAWARNLTAPPGNAIPGATYDVEMVNGLDYALTKGMLKEGDKIGHIYFEGEYGANGLAGSKHFASKHGMQVIEIKAKATDTDMSAPVTTLRSAGVKAIALTISPTATASAAGVAAAQGLDVPLIGNNPVFVPALLTGPSASALKARLLIGSPVNSFEPHPQLLADYKTRYPNAIPSLAVTLGTGAGEVMRQILDKACADGDLTREGVLKAKQSLTDVDTKGLVVPLDFSQVGKSPSTKSFILQPADVPGGAKALTGPVEAVDVKSLG